MELVVQIVVRGGNRVQDVSGDWKPNQVVFMSDPLTDEARVQVGAELPQLEPYRSERTPQNPADEGFVDPLVGVAISFPIGE